MNRFKSIMENHTDWDIEFHHESARPSSDMFYVIIRDHTWNCSASRLVSPDDFEEYGDDILGELESKLETSINHLYD